MSKCHCFADVDECVTSLTACENSGVCENTFGHFNCHCMEGFSGEFCEIRETQDAEKGIDVALAVGVSLGLVVIVLLVIIAVGFFLWCHELRQTKGTVR